MSRKRKKKRQRIEGNDNGSNGHHKERQPTVLRTSVEVTYETLWSRVSSALASCGIQDIKPIIEQNERGMHGLIVVLPELSNSYHRTLLISALAKGMRFTIAETKSNGNDIDSLVILPIAMTSTIDESPMTDD